MNQRIKPPHPASVAWNVRQDEKLLAQSRQSLGRVTQLDQMLINSQFRRWYEAWPDLCLANLRTWYEDLKK
jgi:hypothetical protein